MSTGRVAETDRRCSSAPARRSHSRQRFHCAMPSWTLNFTSLSSIPDLCIFIFTLCQFHLKTLLKFSNCFENLPSLPELTVSVCKAVLSPALLHLCSRCGEGVASHKKGRGRKAGRAPPPSGAVQMSRLSGESALIRAAGGGGSAFWTGWLQKADDPSVP